MHGGQCNVCVDITFLDRESICVHHLSDVPERPHLTCCPLDACLIAQISPHHRPCYIYLYGTSLANSDARIIGMRIQIDIEKPYVVVFHPIYILWFGTNISCIALLLIVHQSK